MKFAYKKINMPPGGRREFLLKPIIPIYLFYKNSFIRLEALIDSGADFCVFHSEIADVLGIRWNKGHAHNFVGITGEKGKVYFHQVRIKIGNWGKSMTCGFSQDLSEYSYGILGQEGFFENFGVHFSLKNESITIN
jgi:hypothetical protein